MDVRWVKRRGKMGGYRSACKRFILSPITAPTGKGMPKFVLYWNAPSRLRWCGTFHEVFYATRYVNQLRE